MLLCEQPVRSVYEDRGILILWIRRQGGANASTRANLATTATDDPLMASNVAVAQRSGSLTCRMAANLPVAQDPAGNLKPAKDRSTERIDGIVALIMSNQRAAELTTDAVF
jgi:hypothetical protein